MGGPRKSDLEAQRQLAATQTGVMNRQLDMAEEDRRQRRTLQQPFIDFTNSILSGDYGAATKAAAVPIGQISRQSKLAQEQIYSDVPAGAARDLALAEVSRDRRSQTADFMNRAFMSGLQGLTGLGSESGQFGLQETGAGLRAGEAAGTTRNNVMQADAARKAATLGFLGNLAGAAGMAAGGGMRKPG